MNAFEQFGIALLTMTWCTCYAFRIFSYVERKFSKTWQYEVRSDILKMYVNFLFTLKCCFPQVDIQV